MCLQVKWNINNFSINIYRFAFLMTSTDDITRDFITRNFNLIFMSSTPSSGQPESMSANNSSNVPHGGGGVGTAGLYDPMRTLSSYGAPLSPLTTPDLSTSGSSASAGVALNPHFPRFLPYDRVDVRALNANHLAGNNNNNRSWI